MANRRHHWTVFCLSGILAFGVGACSGGEDGAGQENVKTAEIAVPAMRGHDPWVFRSVLDRHPRMITLALAPKLWAAYSAETGALYKVWRDGVDFDGAVYATTSHGPQPASLGPAYLIDQTPGRWTVRADGEAITPNAHFAGHRFENGAAILMTELSYEHGGEAHSITVEERPEVTAEGAGFIRAFTVKGAPDGLQVELSTSWNSLAETPKVEGGSWSGSIGDGPEAVGSLILATDGKTAVTARFGEPAIPAPQAEEEGEEKNPLMDLIETSGCTACHSLEEKTIGPSFRQIYGRYEPTESTIARLAAKVVNGGVGAWGDVPMPANSAVTEEDARKMVAYMLGREDGTPIPDKSPLPGNDEPMAEVPEGYRPGVTFKYFHIEEELQGFPVVEAGALPNKVEVFPRIDVHGWRPRRDMLYFGEYNYTRMIVVQASGEFKVETPGTYQFQIHGSGPQRLFIDGELVQIQSATTYDVVSVELDAGFHSFLAEVFVTGERPRLLLSWARPGENAVSAMPNSVFATPKPDEGAVAPGKKPYMLIPPHEVPGLGSPLIDVHPSFTLSQARPESFQRKIGAMDFMEDGRLVVSSWDADGAIFVLDGVTGDDPEAISVKKIASGLAEPLGLKAVDGDIYVMQKQELTRLIDHDGDDVIDEYRVLANSWDVSDNFHEFSFGLLYEDGYFYGTLASDVLPGGNPGLNQPKSRGSAIRVSKETGEVEFIARGLRTPNGIGYGAFGHKYIADNQGNWLPASKIVRLEEGSFYGFRSVDPENDKDLEETPPIVWLPQNEIGNSPSTPGLLDLGPYENQMIHGEVTHGGIKRVSLEEVGGTLQGCVHRFVQGLEAGINRIAWGPDGALYMGGIGNPGNWQQAGKKQYGLQKIAYNGTPVFEILSISTKENGLEVSFSEPMRLGDGTAPEDYALTQWRFVPTEAYGGPKVDEETLAISHVTVNEDRTKAFLHVAGLKPGHMTRLQMTTPAASAADRPIRAPEVWCTNTVLGAASEGFSMSDQSELNALSAAEGAAGWRLLFDGATTDGWRNFGSDGINAEWQVVDGALTLTAPGGGDIVTEETFGSFELSLEWKLNERGNSGIFYHVQEGLDRVWHSGPEYQLLDDDRHPDGAVPKTRAGSIYALYAPKFSVTRPVGTFNETRIVVKDGAVQHWLNGHLIAEAQIGSKEWSDLVAGSKFAAFPEFGSGKPGHIALQDHGDFVAYRNIKIRVLD